MFGWAVTAVQCSVISLSIYPIQKASFMLQKGVTFKFTTFIHVVLGMVDMFKWPPG